jgi:hypothetical protein
VRAYVIVEAHPTVETYDKECLNVMKKNQNFKIKKKRISEPKAQPVFSKTVNEILCICICLE